MPPFFGQGLNSGLRDVTNLGWKLAAVLRGQAAPALLETYERERRDHALTMVRIARLFGRIYAPGSRGVELLRDSLFRLLQGLPALREWIVQMRFKPMPHYAEGLVLHRPGAAKGSPVGRMFMQPRVETADGRQLRLDDAIGDWFAIIGLGQDPAAVLEPGERDFWTGFGARLVLVRPARSPADAPAADPATTVLQDLDGAFADWRLRRPQDAFILLRPDRYVAAACGAAELNEVSAALRRMIGALAGAPAGAKLPAGRAA
jgi:3-(3-hydroxy-phenyl)propionate hydroxylase